MSKSLSTLFVLSLLVMMSCHRNGVDPNAIIQRVSEQNIADDRLEAGYFGVSVAGVQTSTEVIPDHYTATCAETDEGQVYLAIDADPPAGDTRDVDHIGATADDADSLHTADYNFSLGDLLLLVESQAAAHQG